MTVAVEFKLGEPPSFTNTVNEYSGIVSLSNVADGLGLITPSVSTPV